MCYSNFLKVLSLSNAAETPAMPGLGLGYNPALGAGKEHWYYLLSMFFIIACWYFVCIFNGKVRFKIYLPSIQKEGILFAFYMYFSILNH